MYIPYYKFLCGRYSAMLESKHFYEQYDVRTVYFVQKQNTSASPIQ